MATLDTSGIDDLQNQLKRIEAGLRGECIKAMLQAGGEAMAKQWHDTLSVG